MITNEPSTHQTPLPTEPAGFPEQRTPEPLQPIWRPEADSWSARLLHLLIGFLTWFGSVLLLVFVPAIIAVPYLIYRWKTTGLPSGEALLADKTLVLISVLGILPTHVLTLGLVWLIVTQGGKYPFWKTIGFEWPESGPVLGTLACVGMAVLLLAIGFTVTHFWGGGKTQLDLLVESSLAARFATAFVAVFTAPLVEELVYRGVLYSAVQRALGKIVAVGVVSLLFAGVHVFQYSNNIAVITVITLLSVTLTLVRAYSGKVLPSFVIHFVFNGIQSLLIVLAPFVGWDASS
ncbi:MAG TPA: type II CAAX endopeptidase family protein [Pyrinomonadaceae bacterium]|nr:type II CAAX endopeptidase family protein [Pyrinomonadaceae bacterium]